MNGTDTTPVEEKEEVTKPEGLVAEFELPEAFKNEIEALLAQKNMYMKTSAEMIAMVYKTHSENMQKWNEQHVELGNRIVQSMPEEFKGLHYYIDRDNTVKVYETKEALAKAENVEGKDSTYE